MSLNSFLHFQFQLTFCTGVFLLACLAHYCAFKVSLWNFSALTVRVITCDSGSNGLAEVGDGGGLRIQENAAWRRFVGIWEGGL